MQKGYRLHERLLRPARVVVAGEAPATDGPGD
jgi:molecular chaperone GrpE (heat shock protein)